MPERVILVHGFLSADLWLDLPHVNKLWVDQLQLVYGHIVYAALSIDGVTPLPPLGRQLFVGDPLPTTWQTVQVLLGLQLGTAYAVELYSWDWRKDLVNAGNDLAQYIASVVPAGQQCSIAAHSAGGLVAFFAWQALKQFGNENLVRRIVTLGTPWAGSYAPTYGLFNGDPTIQQLLIYNQIAASFPLATQFAFDYQALTTPRCWNLFATFPIWAELYPALFGPDFAVDPNRVEFYLPGNYPAPYAISSVWLTKAQFVLQPLLSNLANYPPPGVLTCVAGTNEDTIFALKGAGLDFRNRNNYFSSPAGDGTVTQISAQYPRAALAQLPCDHASLPLATAQNGMLAGWILDPRRPPVPPPPPQISMTPVPQQVTVPPDEERVFGLRCLGGG